MQLKYNQYLDKEKLNLIVSNLEMVSDSLIIFSQEIETKIHLKLVNDKYLKNKSFELDAKKVVQNNIKNFDNVEILVGYVLEQIALTIYFNKLRYTKVGDVKREKIFDNLLTKYFNFNNDDFLYFDYN